MPQGDRPTTHGWLGGEAYLHVGFLEVVCALADAGITPTMTAGAKGIAATLASSMAALE